MVEWQKTMQEDHSNKKKTSHYDHINVLCGIKVDVRQGGDVSGAGKLLLKFED